MSVKDKKLCIDGDHDQITIARQCELLSLNRSTLYYERVLPSIEDKVTEDTSIMNFIDEQYTSTPFYGSRRMAVMIQREVGISVNRKRVQRLMRQMNITAIYPGPNLSKRNMAHKVYPYLLRGYSITRPNEVWSTDITYVRLRAGFVYLTAVIDWFSRFVLSWQLSNTIDTSLCLDVTNNAFNKGKPAIFNTDQGCQYTSDSFTNLIISNDVKLSMDGKGRALDNIFIERLWRSVKYEDIYIKGYESMEEASHGLDAYFKLYNEKRPHQSLKYKTPQAIHYGESI